MSRALSRVVGGSLSIVLLTLAACGGGGDSGGRAVAPVTLAGITSATPSRVSAASSTTVTLHGAGFGAAGAADVRLVAQGATPFEGGSAAAVTVAGTVVDDATVTFVSPPASTCEEEPISLL